MASLGVDVIKIMVLARWAGDSVLRYVRDAPLENLSAEMRDLEERLGLLGALAQLQPTVQGINDKVDNHKGNTERPAHDFFRKLGPAEEKPFMARVSQRQFKVHEAVVDGTARLPQQWKACCEVRFGLWAFTRQASVSEFPADALCAKCFAGHTGLEQAAAAGSGSSSAVVGS